jgi:hypothetical protein
VKEVDSANIIYAFFQLNENQLLCGERDGIIELVTLNNLDASLKKFTLDQSCGHITQISKTSNPNELMLGCSKGLFFCDV